MKKWILKALLQKTMSSIPFGFKLNYLFQKYVTKAVVLNTDFFEDLLRHTSILLKEHELFSTTDLSQKRALELGTGWHPILPVALFLSGIKETLSIDLNNHIRKENLKVLIEWFLRYEGDGQLGKYLPHIQQERLAVLREVLAQIDSLAVEDILQKFHISHKIGDVTKMNLEKQGYDITSSVNVLEHIHEEVLHPIMQSMNDLSKPGSFHYHSFGCYDHFYHVDKSISKFNYLQYSRQRWKRIDNEIQPQNRMRVNQIADVLESAQFKIVKDLHSEANIVEYEKVNVHEDFAGINPAVAAVDYGTFILTK